MRIALIEKKLRWAGQPHHVFSLALGLREQGHEVFTIAQPDSAFSRRAHAAGLSVTEIAMTNIPAQIAAAIKIARLLRRNRIDILHCHDSRDHQIGCLAAPLAHVPLVRTKHNTLPLRNAGSRWVNGRRSAHLIGVSEAVRRGLIHDGIDPSHITTVYGFIDSLAFRPRSPNPELRRKLGLPEGVPIVGTVGRLHRAKGIADLVEAMPTIVAGAPDVHFLMVGGSYLWWPPRVQELGLADRCIFTDAVTNVADYLGLMDLLVFPTLREAFGLSILEALSAQRPVIATRTGGIPEMIQHEANGLLVNVEQPDQIASAVLRLLRNPDLAARLARAGRETATRVFTKDRCIRETLTVYARAGKP